MSEKVRVSNSAYYKMIFGKVLSGLGILLAALLVLYLVFAATIMRFIPSSNAGAVLVKDPSFEGGLIPKGAVVVVGDPDRPEGLWGNLYNTFVPQDISIVKVEAGPTGKIEWAEGGVLTVDGKLVDVLLEEDPGGEFLSGRYVVKCLEGCESDSFTITSDQVVGIPLIDKYRVKTDIHESLAQSAEMGE